MGVEIEVVVEDKRPIPQANTAVSGVEIEVVVEDKRPIPQANTAVSVGGDRGSSRGQEAYTSG